MSTELHGFVSVPEAAKMIGVTSSLVRRWVRNGTLPHTKIGEKTRIIPIKAVKALAKAERKPGPRKA